MSSTKKHEMVKLWKSADSNEQVSELARKWVSLRRRAISINEELLTLENIIYQLQLIEKEKTNE